MQLYQGLLGPMCIVPVECWVCMWPVWDDYPNVRWVDIYEDRRLSLAVDHKTTLYLELCRHVFCVSVCVCVFVQERRAMYVHPLASLSLSLSFKWIITPWICPMCHHHHHSLWLTFHSFQFLFRICFCYMLICSCLYMYMYSFVWGIFGGTQLLCFGLSACVKCSVPVRVV